MIGAKQSQLSDETWEKYCLSQRKFWAKQNREAAEKGRKARELAEYQEKK